MNIKPGDLLLGLSLGGISLGSLEDTLITVIKMHKAGTSEIRLLQQFGMVIALDEAIYLQEERGLIGPEWDPLVLVKNGRVKMISIQRVVRDEQTKDKVWDDALILYTHELGGPTSREDDQLIWELSNARKVTVEKKGIFGGTGGWAITIVLSCEDPEKLPSIK
jgi:hypothetical protein